MSKVLIHGAGYGADCWDRLLPHLDGGVLAVDLPGRGTRADVALGDVTLPMCAEAVRDDIVAHDMRDVVLVGHSMAGITVPRVVELVPERIRHIVLVSGVVPSHGTRVLDGIDPDVRGAVEATIREGVYAQTLEANVMMLCNDLDDEASAWALERVVDEAAALLGEPVDLTGYTRAIPTTYVRLDLDCCLPPELQAAAQERVGAEAVHIEAGHMVMIGQPRRLAEVLNRLDPATDRDVSSA
jgi:pimeloyl-ACP methyl ester carboxylesterase